MRQSFTHSPDADSHGERESLRSPQLGRERDAARQRAAATRRETDEARATHMHSNVRVTTKAPDLQLLGHRQRYSSNNSGVLVGRVLDSSQRHLILL